MRHTDHRGHLEVDLETKECTLPPDELARMQEPLDQIARTVGNLPARLEMTIVYHPRTARYHVDAGLRLPRRTLFTGDWDSYLDTALTRSMHKLIHKAEAYQEEPDREQDALAERIDEMNRDIMAPEDPAVGELAAASEAGDYARFRHLLGDYEQWIRLRVGRWLQRYPEANAELGGRLSIGDLVEEMFLNAFEHYSERPTIKPLHEWIDDLLDPSLRALWDDPEEERESISHARTVREMQA